MHIFNNLAPTPSSQTLGLVPLVALSHNSMGICFYCGHHFFQKSQICVYTQIAQVKEARTRQLLWLNALIKLYKPKTFTLLIFP